MEGFRPMLASPAREIKFPVYASPKLDGIRAMVIDGKLMARSLKPIANEFLQRAWGMEKFNGLDGELIMGPPNGEGVYNRTQSAVNSIAGQPWVTFHVFDYISQDHPYEARLRRIQKIVANTKSEFLVVVPQVLVTSMAELDEFETQIVSQGFEGAMLRDPQSGYKFGRSTANEGWLLKVKRFEDSDAEILEVVERMHNANEAKTNELGYAERSSHKANKHGTGIAGSLRVRDIHSGVEFNIGTGFTVAVAYDLWQHRADVVGKIAKYKFQPSGVKDKPRFPTFLGLRLEETKESLQ